MYLLGYDIGSSSVKASLVEVESSACIATAYSPKREMPIQSPFPGWAEQEPEMWWEHLITVTREIIGQSGARGDDIVGIGISYQMHGLVCVDKQDQAIRPAIIWCDSRAVELGEKAFREMGKEHCLSRYLNSPGNFTASKLKWVKEHEPHVYERIRKIMLPGDYIALKLTGEISTTVSGLSEGILWDFTTADSARDLLDYYGIDANLLPSLTETFTIQGKVSAAAAQLLNLKPGIPVAYRAGDQPNNAFSLHVMNPGEIAATAGTSGVVYGVTDQIRYDPVSRVNVFAHVNHTRQRNRLGVLLCINGTGILNAWLKSLTGYEAFGYPAMNEEAGKIAPGSDNLSILPFGNGAERMLENRNIGCVFSGIDFIRHTRAHLFRAVQEGIAFSFRYGMDIMKQTGMNPAIIRAGNANMFLSSVFREALSCISGATIELYNTDGSQGAAIGAGLGAGIYTSPEQAFSGLKQIMRVEPDVSKTNIYEEAYNKWVGALNRIMR